MSFFEFPHSRTYDSDLGWLIWAMKKLIGDMTEFTEINSIKFGDPINWNISTQYEPTTIVVDDEGNGYISRKAVPAGIALTDTDYWTRIFNFSDITDTIRESIAVNAGDSATTPVALNESDLVWWKGNIYRVQYDIAAGTAFIEGTNVIPYTVNDRIQEVGADIGTIEDDIIALQNADTLLQGAIESEAENRQTADNALNDNIEALSNEVDELAGSILSDAIKTFMVRPIFNKLRYKSEYPITKAIQGAVALSDSELFVIYANNWYGAADMSADCVVYSIPNMTVLRQARLNVAHGQSVTVKDGLCYITTMGQSIFIVDPVNMTLLREIVIDANKRTVGIAYNPDDDCFYINFTGEVGTIYRYNSEFQLLDNFTISSYVTKHGCGGLDIDIYNGILYFFIWEPNYTICYDLREQKTIRVLKNPEYLERHVLKESEFITHTPSGTFYTGYNNGANNNTDPYTENVICLTDFTVGLVESDNYIVGANTYNTVQTLYIDTSYTGSFSDGTQEYPYKEIQQACDNFNQRAFISLNIAAGTYCETQLMERQFYVSAGDSNVIVEGLTLINCLANIGAIQIVANAGRDYALEINNGRVIIASAIGYPIPSINVIGGASVSNSGIKPTSLRIVNGEYIVNTRVQPFLDAEFTKVLNVGILKGVLRVPVSSGQTSLTNNRYDDFRNRFLWVDVTVNGNTQSIVAPLVYGTTDIPVAYNGVSGKIRVNLNQKNCTITLTNCTIGSGTYILLSD